MISLKYELFVNFINFVPSLVLKGFQVYIQYDDDFI